MELGKNAVYAGIAVAVAALLVFAVFMQGKSNAETDAAGSIKLDGAAAGLSQEKANAVREISITAKKWEFLPSTIRIKRGERIRLKINSIDVPHGFAIPEYGIDEYIEPGKETVIEFTADKAGTFQSYCSVYCGVGHSAMRGTIVIE